MDDEKHSPKSSPELEIRMGNLGIKAKQTVSILVAMISIVVAIITFYMGFSGGKLKHAIENETQKNYHELIYRIEKSSTKQLMEIEERIKSFENDFQNLSNLPENAQYAAEISKLKVGVEDVGARIKKIEDAILEDPAKALEIPLLEKEVENIRETLNSDVVELRAEITRVYDLNKWFIGLMFSMAIGIIGLAITNFIKSPKGNDS